jgi:UDP-4-amino-4,6-dideoxy-N-acetyl-beta-L-altrosamine transaminase
MSNKTKQLFYSKQSISNDDIEKVVETLKSTFLTQGPMVPEFEEKFSNYSGAKYGVATNSATSALHVACMSLDLGKGDTLWTSPNSFVASANCAIYCGAKVDFVDIDPNTYNMSISLLEKKLKKAKLEGNLPKIVIPVHYAGQSSEMQKIYDLSLQYGFKIVEDASHAAGADYKNKKVGCCEYSHIAVFSFHPIKIITTIEGGMALTNDENLAERLKRHRSHGITSDTNYMSPRKKNEVWNYQQIMLGYNYRMTDVQAALGLSQLNRIDSFVSARRNIAKLYDQALSSTGYILPFQRNDTKSSYHLYPIRVNLEKCKKKQIDIINFLEERNIVSNLHYIPIYRQPFFEKLGFKQGYCPEAESFHCETISIPIYPDLKREEQEKVISVLIEALI